MPRTVILDKELKKIIRKETKSKETTGTEFELIIDKNGIRPIEFNEARKGIKIGEKDYIITLEIENTSNEIAELTLITFKDFIITELGNFKNVEKYISEDKIIRTENIFLDFSTDTPEIINITLDIIPLKNLSNKEEFKFSIKEHQIKMVIEKINPYLKGTITKET